MRKVGYVLGLLTVMASLAIGQTKTYTVREGDTISGIASRLSVRQADLLQANSLSSTKILKIGMKLAVPSSRHFAGRGAYSAPLGGGYTVKSGDNDWVIAKRFHLTVHNLHLMNPGVDWDHLKPGLTLAARPSGGSSHRTVASFRRTRQVAARKPSARVYTVKPGDNDWTIANHMGIASHNLRAANPGVDWDRLQIGTRLQIPHGAVRMASAPAVRSRYAKIARDSVVIRRKPSTDADKITVVEAGLPVTVLDRHAGWYKLKFPKGTVGWVRGDMIKSAKRPVVAHHRRSRQSDSSPRYTHRRRRHRDATVAMATPAGATSVVKKAFTKLGQRYTWGHNDCSGYVMTVMRSQGVHLPHSSRAQSRMGNRVGRGEMRPGDLVFFKTNRGTRINHVGIYIGHNKFIHASSGKGHVTVSSLSEGYYRKRFATARRVLSSKRRRRSSS